MTGTNFPAGKLQVISASKQGESVSRSRSDWGIKSQKNESPNGTYAIGREADGRGGGSFLQRSDVAPYK